MNITINGQNYPTISRWNWQPKHKTYTKASDRKQDAQTIQYKKMSHKRKIQNLVAPSPKILDIQKSQISNLLLYIQQVLFIFKLVRKNSAHKPNTSKHKKPNKAACIHLRTKLRTCQSHQTWEITPLTSGRNQQSSQRHKTNERKAPNPKPSQWHKNVCKNNHIVRSITAVWYRKITPWHYLDSIPSTIYIH